MVTQTPQPKHFSLSNFIAPFSRLLALNWHLWIHFPQFMHVSGLVTDMYLLAVSASGIPNRTSALIEWQQQEQQLHMTSGFSFPSNVYVM